MKRFFDWLFLSKEKRDEMKFLNNQYALLMAGREDEAINLGRDWQIKKGIK